MYSVFINTTYYHDESEKALAEALVKYLLFDAVPETTPALWQDVAILTRYLKRDVWSIDDSERINAQYALEAYQAKYIVEHLSKPEILKSLDDFFKHASEKTLVEVIERKLHAPLRDLLLTQEKRVVTKDDLDKFDELFKYPAWLEFDDEATVLVFERIMRGELSDEQIDYFLGANDDIKNYDQWFAVAKHILATTQNAHTFWIAGDILSIVSKAVPDDEESQKWLKDEIFNIFWPHVQSVWPILHKHDIDFEENDFTQILGDSIGWLEDLDDLKERLPNLGAEYEPTEHNSEQEDEDFRDAGLTLRGLLEDKSSTLADITHQVFDLAELVYNQKSLDRFEQLVQEKVLPTLERYKDDNVEKARDMIKHALDHSRRYIATLQHEQANMVKVINQAKN